jgi:hypothetical protein
MVVERLSRLRWDECAQPLPFQFVDLFTDIIAFETDMMETTPSLDKLTSE